MQQTQDIDLQGDAMKRIFAAVLFALLIAAAPARAATITDVVNFSVSDFSCCAFGGSPPSPTPPYSQLIGSFTVTFDQFASTTGEAATSPYPIILNSLNVPGSSFSFNYTPPAFVLQTCTLHNPCGGGPLLFQDGILTVYGTLGTDDELILTIANINTSPIIAAAYTEGSLKDTWVNGGMGSVTVSSDPPSPVPLPPTLPLFGSGIVVLAGLAWRRGKVS
jgi:hypothetical protein